MVYVRMTEYQLVDKGIADISNIEIASLGTYARIEADMEQHIAKLLADVVGIRF